MEPDDSPHPYRGEPPLKRYRFDTTVAPRAPQSVQAPLILNQPAALDYRSVLHNNNVFVFIQFYQTLPELFSTWQFMSKTLNALFRELVKTGWFQTQFRNNLHEQFSGSATWFCTLLKDWQAVLIGSTTLHLMLKGRVQCQARQKRLVEGTQDEPSIVLDAGNNDQALYKPGDVDVIVSYVGDRDMQRKLDQFCAAANEYYRSVGNPAGRCEPPARLVGKQRPQSAVVRGKYSLAMQHRLRKVRNLVMKNDHGSHVNQPGGHFHIQLLFVDWSQFASVHEYVYWAFHLDVMCLTFDGERVSFSRRFVEAMTKNRGRFVASVPSTRHVVMQVMNNHRGDRHYGFQLCWTLNVSNADILGVLFHVRTGLERAQQQLLKWCLYRHFPLRVDIKTEPYWLEVVHKNNLACEHAVSVVDVEKWLDYMQRYRWCCPQVNNFLLEIRPGSTIEQASAFRQQNHEDRAPLVWYGLVKAKEQENPSLPAIVVTAEELKSLFASNHLLMLAVHQDVKEKRDDYNIWQETLSFKLQRLQQEEVANVRQTFVVPDGAWSLRVSD